MSLCQCLFFGDHLTTPTKSRGPLIKKSTCFIPTYLNSLNPKPLQLIYCGIKVVSWQTPNHPLQSKMELFINFTKKKVDDIYTLAVTMHWTKRSGCNLEKLQYWISKLKSSILWMRRLWKSGRGWLHTTSIWISSSSTRDPCTWSFRM